MEGKSLKPFVMHPYSYAFGKSTKCISYDSLGKCLECMAAKYPNKTAVISIHENIEKTFYQLDADVNQLVKGLSRFQNITTGDVVAIMTANCYNFVLVQYACAKIGAILCPINAYYRSSELEFCLKKVNPKVLFLPSRGSPQEFTVNKIFDVFTEIASKLPSKLSSIVLLDGERENAIHFQFCDLQIYTFSELLSHKTDLSDDDINNNNSNPIDADEVCALYFTSGTTGSPKAAALSHFNLTNNTRFFGERLGFKSDKTAIVCLPVPIFHVFGSVLGTTTMATTSATMVMPNYRYDVQSVVEAMVRYKCTHFMGVPAMLIDIMNHVEDNNIRIQSLTGVITAATTVPFDVVQRFASLIPSIKKIDIVYGATETSPIITSPLPESKLKDTLDNVGLPLDFVEVKLVDRETKQIVKIGEKGELWTRGPHVMVGYWNDEEQTKNSINARKWYNTGDLATMDEDGCFRVVGRTKEIIIRGGINVFPREIEDVLITHPLIKNAAVCGIPDERLGEEVCAWIILRDNSKRLQKEEVRDFCSTKLAYFKIPRQILIVEEFPMTKSGKVQKFKMSEISLSLLAEQNVNQMQ